MPFFFVDVFAEYGPASVCVPQLPFLEHLNKEHNFPAVSLSLRPSSIHPSIHPKTVALSRNDVDDAFNGHPNR